MIDAATRAGGAQARRGAPGFTLVELMVSVVLMGIVIIAVFAFFSSMSNVFHTQEQIIDTQSGLRFAVEYVNQDVRRAGFLGTPSAAQDPLICPKPAAAPVGLQYSAVWVVNDDAGSSVYTGGTAGAANKNIFPDSLYLLGSMDVPGTFALDGVTPGRAVLNGVSVAQLLSGADDAENEARFTALFKTNRMVRVSTPDGRAQLGFVTGATWDTGQPVVLVGGLVAREGDLGCGLEGVSGQNYELSVLNLVRYQVRQSAADETRSDLLRAEIDPLSGDAFDGSEISVLDHVVDFQVWADIDKGVGVQPNMVRDNSFGDDIGNETWANMVNQWHRARVLYVMISARTPREDKTLFHIPRELADGGGGDIPGPLLSFNLDDDENGAAHVVTQSAAVELRNLTLRNLH